MNIQTKKIALIGLFAAILCILSPLSIPLPSGVPVTLQTLVVALCGFVLGPKLGMASLGVYLLLGAVGLPVFSGFGAGIGKILGVTGGFLIGFVPMAALCGLGARVHNKLRSVALMGAGLIACHLMGAAQFALVSGSSFWGALTVASLPYLAKDVLSVVAARLLALALSARLKRA